MQERSDISRNEDHLHVDQVSASPIETRSPHPVTHRMKEKSVASRNEDQLHVHVDHVSAKPVETRSTNLDTHRTVPGRSDMIDTTQQLIRQQAELTKMLAEQQSQATLPHRNIPMYNGDPLEYVPFIRAFERAIEWKTDNDSDRMYYLENYTSGEPNTMVKGMMSKRQAYAETKKMLEKKYGNKYVISAALQRKAEKWPNVKADDTKSWNELSTFLVAYYHTMFELNALEEVDHSGCIRTLMVKLPYGFRNQWRTRVNRIEEEQNRMAGFKDFVDLVEKQTKIVSNPLYGDIGGGGEKSRSNKNTNKEWPKKRAYATSVQQKKEKSTATCTYCENKHNILDCNKFKKLERKDKSEFCFKQGLCFGCLRKGHNKTDCRKPELSKCKICDRNHPTVLHDYKQAEQNKDNNEQGKKNKAKNKAASEKRQAQSTEDSPKTSHVTTGCTGILGAGTKPAGTCTMTILPVLVKTSTSIISTYAFIDNGCGAVFAERRLQMAMRTRTKPTKFVLKTMSSQDVFETQVIEDTMQVGNIDGTHFIDLPTVIVKDGLPVTIEDMPSQDDLAKFRHLSHIKLPSLTHNCIPRVSLMIGSNVPAATLPLEVASGTEGDPYAIKTPLGWMIYGLPGKFEQQNEVNVNFCRLQNATIQSGLEDLQEQLAALYDTDFTENARDSRSEWSVNDKKFISLVENSVQMVDGHFQIGLPFKNPSLPVPNNKSQAEVYAKRLKHKLSQNEQLYEQYTDFMNNLEDQGYCERVPECGTTQSERIWYIPHHAVFNPHKPDKVRVVFNCPASYRGTSLNQQLLQGPDLANHLQGVLLRWRKEPIAVTADIEAMFYQVRVRPEDCDMLRFLWWPKGQLTGKLEEYRMLVHVFGAVCSPSIANYALRRIALECKETKPEVANVILNAFYVDDMLKAFSSETEAVQVSKATKETLQERGFNLTKWLSNSREVIDSIPMEHRSKDVKDLDMEKDTLPTERVLGVRWDVQNDKIKFSHTQVKKLPTRRNILSIMSSLFDPLGMVAPYTLQARMILQELCRMKVGWDDDIPQQQQKEWESWTSDLEKLDRLEVDRCLKPETITHPDKVQLHHFADASNKGYGVVTYIRYVEEEAIHCAFMMAKARVCPLKKITIPRLELTAARVAVRVDVQLHRELKESMTEDIESHFWTDSQTVLKYINSETSRFHTFVANRVGEIREMSHPSQWHYVPTDDNPADDCSRGLTMNKLLKTTRWFHGPDFLWKEESQWPQVVIPDSLDSGDPEVKTKTLVAAVQIGEHHDPVNELISYFSDWTRLKRAVAWWLRLKKILQNRSKKQEKHENMKHLSVEELQKAEEAIVAVAQQEAFAEEITALERHKEISHNSVILNLDPILTNGILRVGGRLHNALIPEDAKHQMILPKSHHISDLIIAHTHQQCNHQGRNHMLAKLRQKFWMIGAGARIKKQISGCVVCRRQRAKVGTQKMADLPANRVKPDEPPFSTTGMDYFGPFEIKQGRSLRKRYGVIFTCMVSRAIHIEIADSLDTSSCINVIRRFVCRRGHVKEIVSDNGTNLVGANKELRRSLQELNEQSIQKFTSSMEIKWRFNPPGASHHGGVWERHIRTVRKILQCMLAEQHMKVARSDDQLHTLMCEIEATMNSRPLTRVSQDPSDLDVLTPNHLLQLRNPAFYPPGVFDEKDAYAQRRWRQVQYMADIFWRRWTAEYMPTLQKRQRWLQPKRNLKIGDIVLVIDSSAPRNTWTMGRVEKVNIGSQGLVRSATVKTKSSVLLRPISKLCMLLEQE